MNRRDFLTATTTTAVTSVLYAQAQAGESPAAPREYYELRRYHLRRGPKQKVFEDYLRQAWFPAMAKLGIGPIGAFQVMLGPESPSLYLLIPYPSLDAFARLPSQLRADEAYVKTAAEASGAPPGDPVYHRIESSLLAAFSGIPRIEIPKQTRENQPRIFELRTYESHSKRANLKKIEMFNEGEIAIYRRTGLTPVFFGETLIGTRIPNLTYLLVFDDMAARDLAWRTFVADPEWRKLSTTPGYTDPEIVTDISNLLLRPTAYSQI